MTEEMKKSCYEYYLRDFYYERKTYKGAMTYEEFCYHFHLLDGISFKKDEDE